LALFSLVLSMPSLTLPPDPPRRTTFGHSAPEKELFDHFGFGVDGIASKCGAWYSEKSGAGSLPGVGEFDELLLNLHPPTH